MAVIKAVRAREILDSRGNPTIETMIWADNGAAAVASVPSGASKGEFEALELRDGDQARFKGMGELKAVDNVNTIIAPKIIGMDPTYQGRIDKLMIDLDGTENKEKLGANAILSVSQGVCELGAAVCRRQTFQYINEKYRLGVLNGANMPTPVFNLINGGQHGAGSNLDFQEFQVIPSSSQTFTLALQMGEVIYQNLKEALKKRNASYSVGDEGGFSPSLYSNADALELLVEAISTSNYTYGKDVFLGLDVASDEFFKEGKYVFKDKSVPLTGPEMVEYYQQLCKDYKLLYLEDGMMEDDFDGWTKLTSVIGQTNLVVGDDFLATNKKRLLKAISMKSCNAVLVKPNQIGTISETVEVIKIAKENNWDVVVSHRSGETTDDFIADLAVGVGAPYVKFGAPARGERVVKYNRLTAIDTYLNARRS